MEKKTQTPPAKEDSRQAENKNRDLDNLVAELRKSNLRQFTCLNDWGYSQSERNIVDAITAPYKNERKALLDENERLKKDGFDETFRTCEQLRECHNLLDEIDYILNSDGYEPECNIRTKINQLIKKLKNQ